MFRAVTRTLTLATTLTLALTACAVTHRTDSASIGIGAIGGGPAGAPAATSAPSGKPALPAGGVKVATTTVKTAATAAPTPPPAAAAVIQGPPPTPPPAPPASVGGAFPSAANTGVPAGVGLRPSGGLTITQPGTVIDGLDIQGAVRIAANNVTIRNSRIRNAEFDTVLVADGITGAVLQDVEINGTGQSAGNNGVYGQATIIRANIWNVENGVALDSGSLLLDSYIHDLASVGDPHYDGVQLDGGRSNITIRHNTIISNPFQTSAIMIDNEFGPAANIVIDGNRLAGGGYTVYSDAQFSGGPITGVQVINNRFGQHQYGYALIRGNTLSVSSGNIDELSNRPVNIS